MPEQTTDKVKWTDLVPVLAIAVTQAPTPEERAAAMSELVHLASIVDHHIANLETLKEDQKPQGNIICPDCGVRGSHAFGCPLAQKEGLQ